MDHQSLSSFIWSVADLLRGDYKQSEYGRVILPFTVLRRLDCVLDATKANVLAEFETRTKAGLNPDPFLIRKAKQSFFNTSPLDLIKLLGDQDNIRTNLYTYKRAPLSRIFRNEDFGYTTITVERPLRDEQGNVVLGGKGKQKGKPQPDSALRDTENVLLGEDIRTYFEREVLPHAPDAWIDEERSKVGYEIPFNRHFYVFEPPRNLHEIDKELRAVAANIMAMLGELAE